MAAVDDLRELAPPPAEPPPPPRPARPLPSDYLALAAEWGPGAFDDFLWLLVPGAENPNLDLDRQAEVRLGALRELGEDTPYPLGELLPWAFTDNGDVLFWHTAGEPDAWTVAVNESRGPEWHLFDGGAADFLVAFLSGRERVPVFPDDVPSEAPGFSR